MQWLTVHALGREFGLDAGRVRELAPCSPVTRVPGSARVLRGLVGLRGLPIPVLDLALRLGGRPVAIGSRTPLVILTARLDGEPVEIAFLVDGAGTLLDVAEPLRSLPLDALAPEGVCIGFAEVEDDLVPLLDVDVLVARNRLDEMVTRTSLQSVRARSLPRSEGASAPVREAEDRGSREVPAPAPERKRQEPGAGGAAASLPVAENAAALPGFGRKERPKPLASVVRARDEAPKPRFASARAGPPDVMASSGSRQAPFGEHRSAGRMAVGVHEPAPRSPAVSAHDGGLGWLGFAIVAALALGLVTLFGLVVAELQDHPSLPVASKASRDERDSAERATPSRRVASVEPAVLKAPAAPKASAVRTGPASVAQAPAAKQAAIARAPRPEAEILPCEIHEIRPGDTLWAIAGRYLQNPFRWPEIHRRNRDTIEDPDVIAPHARLRVTGSCTTGGRLEPATSSGPRR